MAPCESISPVQPSQDPDGGAFRGAFGDPRGRSRRRPFQRGRAGALAGARGWRSAQRRPCAPRRRRRHAAGGAHGPAQVRCWMLLPLALLLGGCVSQPAPMSPKVTVGGSVGGVSAGAPGATQAAPVCRRSGRDANDCRARAGVRVAVALCVRSGGRQVGGRGIVPTHRAFLGGRRGGQASAWQRWRRASMSGSGWFGATVFQLYDRSPGRKIWQRLIHCLLFRKVRMEIKEVQVSFVVRKASNNKTGTFVPLLKKAGLMAEADSLCESAHVG